MDSGAFRNTARDALLRRLGVQPVQTTQAFAPAATTGGYTPATTAFSPAAGSGPSGTSAEDDAPDGKPCTRNGECGRNKACIDGFCRKPDKTLDGRQCTRSQDCPQGKKCENGNCVPKTDGGGGGGDGSCPAPCAAGTTCKNGACVPDGGNGCRDASECDPGQSCTGGVCTTPGEDGPAATCTTQTDCKPGERCMEGKCETDPALPGQIYSDIDSDPTKYLGNLARKATLQAEGGTAFGNFLANRAFPNIQSAYEEEGLTNPNLDFKTWLSRQSRFGSPDLTMVKRSDLPPLDPDGTDPADPGEQPDPAAGETCSKANPNGICNGDKRVCKNGVCKKRKSGGGGGGGGDNGNGDGPACGPDTPCPAGQRCGNNGKCKAPDCSPDKPCGEGKVCVNGVCEKQGDIAQQYDPSYDNVQGFANYLRDLYYGASSTDRGQQNARFGQGATRWSAW